MNCKISWFGVVRFYISVVQSFDRPKLLSLSTWKIWKGEPRIVKIWWMFQIYYHIRVGQTTSLQNKINRAQSWSQSNIFFKRSFIFEWEHEHRTPGYLFYFYSNFYFVITQIERKGCQWIYRYANHNFLRRHLLEVDNIVKLTDMN